VTGFILKLCVPLGSVIDGLSSFLAEPNKVTSVEPEPFATAVAAAVGEPYRPTVAWVLFTVKSDFNAELEVVVVVMPVLAFTEGDTAVFPKLNKLLVVSVTSGFRTLITVLTDDELKPSVLTLLLSDADALPACSLEDA
jgi:hypothetical protein